MTCSIPICSQSTRGLWGRVCRQMFRSTWKNSAGCAVAPERPWARVWYARRNTHTGGSAERRAGDGHTARDPCVILGVLLGVLLGYGVVRRASRLPLVCSTRKHSYLGYCSPHAAPRQPVARLVAVEGASTTYGLKDY